jgi:hypothetical protein
MKDERAAMSRAIGAVLAAVVALMVVTAPMDAQTPSVMVMPRSGNQFQSFTFVGSGFTEGTKLHVTFTAPDGEEFPYNVGGERGVVSVGMSGGFTVTAVPAIDFAGARTGQWTAEFCVTDDATDCWTVEFTVSRRL